MKLELICAWHNLRKLLKFLVLYLGGVALLLWLAPMAALLIEDLYESMSGMLKLSAVLAFLVSVTTWHILGRRRAED